MSARETNLREACGLGDEAGKDIRDTATAAAADGVHPALTAPAYPHLQYGDAVHTALYAAGLSPDHCAAGLRTERPGTGRELFLTISWLATNPDLQGPVCMDLVWSHLTGWAVRTEDDIVLLAVDELADPVLLVDAARHYVRHGADRAWLAPFEARWEQALELDIALVHYDEQEVR